MKFSELSQKINGTGHSSFQTNSTIDPDVTRVAAIDEATPDSISYIEGAKFAAQVKTTAAGALILPRNADIQAEATARNIAWVEAADPRLAFAQAIALFYQPFKPAPTIHPTAVIDPSATIGQGVAIAAHVVIQAGVVLGDQVAIHPNVVIYPDVQIGDRTVLHANCVIHERAKIGADCVIHSGAAIGAEGFGFVPTATGWCKMEQSGYVVLEDGVEVGCNSAIDRPAVGETRIGQQTKIDNLVHLAHGCTVGQGCAFAAQVGLAGGVQVGNRVILAGQVGAANNTKIGDGAIAAAKTGIHGTVEPGATISGSPAMPHRIFLKASAIYTRLPEIYQTIKQLQRRLGEPSDL